MTTARKSRARDEITTVRQSGPVIVGAALALDCPITGAKLSTQGQHADGSFCHGWAGRPLLMTVNPTNGNLIALYEYCNGLRQIKRLQLNGLIATLNHDGQKMWWEPPT